MQYSENTLNIIVAKSYKGIGRAWIINNLNGNEDEDEIVFLINRYAKGDYQTTVDEFKRKKLELKQKFETLEGFVDCVVSFKDKNFPPYKGKVKISECPVILFYKGNLNLLDSNNKNIAVIGLLNPDDSIKQREEVVVDTLVKKGVTIVSGLALGCDKIAHEQALKSNGTTIAILPSSLDNILPALNRELAHEIVNKNGLLISEYYDKPQSKYILTGRYIERDRLQALFSDSIILSASYAKNDKGNDSGSRLAMGYAFNYGIPRAVIYDAENDSDNPKYDLNRQIIRQQKDVIIINPNNVNDAINKIILKKPEINVKKESSNDLFT